MTTTTDLLSSYAAYWEPAELRINTTIFLNIITALVLGLFVGYERSYRGRAAGMRTFGLTSAASCAICIVAGYPEAWFGGHPAILAAPDPTRVIAGVVTGIGFLGAGAIMRDGFSISGLTTAASLWATSAIGIMVGVGFHAAAILLAVLSALCMSLGGRLERRLPSKPSVAIAIQFSQSGAVREEDLCTLVQSRGYEVAPGSLCLSRRAHLTEWRFLAIAHSGRHVRPLSELAEQIERMQGVDGYQITPSRN